MTDERRPLTTTKTLRTRGEAHAAAEYALLGLLREGPRHGYALAAAFAPEGMLGEVVRLGTSQMYAYLHKLERQGWIAAQESAGTSEAPEAPGDGHAHGERTRRAVQLTPAGARAFADWIAAPVAATREIRLDFLLKLTFALAEDPAQARTLLTRQRAATAAWLDRLSARLPARADATGTTGTMGSEATQAPHDIRALVLRHRVRQSEATLAWLDEALAALG